MVMPNEPKAIINHTFTGLERDGMLAYTEALLALITRSQGRVMYEAPAVPEDQAKGKKTKPEASSGG